MKFTKFKLYTVKALRIAFTTVTWLDLYSSLTHISIFGFERNLGFLIADSITAFLLYCWEDACYEEYCFKLAEEELNKKVDEKPKRNLYSIRGKKDDKNE